MRAIVERIEQLTGQLERHEGRCQDCGDGARTGCAEGSALWEELHALAFGRDFLDDYDEVHERWHDVSLRGAYAALRYGRAEDWDKDD